MSQSSKKLDTICPHCHAHFVLLDADHSPAFCVHCGGKLQKSKQTEAGSLFHEGETLSPTLIPGHIPKEEKVLFSIGPYQILQSIGKGGMGEVLLAYDTNCGRRIALKRIRDDLIEHKQLYNRFLKEARVTSQLTHPAIIPIYTIQAENQIIYYTMPYVEGETLKQMLRKARLQEKKGAKLDQIGLSIPSLVRIFLTICQAVAYAHSKGVLHRDLKPENIIVGKYAQVIILDWGLAKLIHSQKNHNDQLPETPPPKKSTHRLSHLTRLGKIVGTVSYMAPERALGNPATVQSDIYSLGVMLYQILTLKQPFQRGSLKEFREKIPREAIPDPIEIAPYREVPRLLASIALKCLSPNPDLRYASVESLIHDIENYIEGRAEWLKIAELHIHDKKDWEFQENVLIAEHIAITRSMEVSDWVSLMISQRSFAENIKLEASVRLGEGSNGIGFLLNVPEEGERQHLNDGYCIWLGSDRNKSTKFLRSTVEILEAPEVFLPRHAWHKIVIEKMDKTLHVSINGVLELTYVSYLPLVGTHVGVLSRDADYDIIEFCLYEGSQNITISCLAVPDAFLAHQDYTMALSEYRRIGYAFPGRMEGREALFRAGITLLEQANSASNTLNALPLYDLALNEFEKLHRTPGAPLEYLGKGLVYQALQISDEEIKCFELAYRRYPKHPLLNVLQEHIITRMHETSRTDRYAAYQFILLAVYHIPDWSKNQPVLKLVLSLEKHWEQLPFLENAPVEDDTRFASFAIPLAFWLAKPYVLEELIDDLSKRDIVPESLIVNALVSLIELNATTLAVEKIKHLEEQGKNIAGCEIFKVCTAEYGLENSLKGFIGSVNFHEERILMHLLNQALDQKQTELVHAALARLQEPLKLPLICCNIWAYLLENDWKSAGELLHRYPLEWHSKETTLLHFLYGCWLTITEGKELAMIHFSGVLEVPYPRTWTLASHFLIGKLSDEWFKKAFLYEKRQLYRQLSLYYTLTKEEDKALQYSKLRDELGMMKDEG